MKVVCTVADAAELQLQLGIFLGPARLADDVGQRVILAGSLEQPIDALQPELQR